MDIMSNSEENHKGHIKDISSFSIVSNEHSLYALFLNKANKLITALYMVTDIMDKDEPMRIKLRSLGSDVLSDLHESSGRVDAKVSETLSFLNIAFMVGMISEMNFNILMKEFSDLQNSIKSKLSLSVLKEKEISLEDFLKDEPISPAEDKSGPKDSSLGHARHTRIGVQKGETLMKALSNKISDMSLKSVAVSENFDVLKRERRQEIMNILKGHASLNPNGFTITDIKNLATGAVASCGSKT